MYRGRHEYNQDDKCVSKTTTVYPWRHKAKLVARLLATAAVASSLGLNLDMSQNYKMGDIQGADDKLGQFLSQYI